jgi:hypothetical protein
VPLRYAFGPMTSTAAPGFVTRLFVLSWVAFFRTLFDGAFAAGVVRLRGGEPALPAETKTTEEKVAKESVVLREATPDAALQLLALLQREGRFVDFLQEDMASFSDAQIGGAARVVHDGCRKAIAEHLPLAPVRSEEEGASITLEKGFDAASVRLTGNVAGQPPFRGSLAHRGWRVREVKLPKMAEGHDPTIVAPAEVEL